VNLVEATLPIYTGGRVTSSIAAAEAELSAQKENLTGAYQDLRLSVASAFFTVLRTDDMAKLSREAVERLQAHVDNVSMLMEAGRVGRADLLRSEVELFDTERQMINATNQYEVAIKQLNDLMGLPLDTPLRLRGTMSYVEFPYTLEECIADAMEKHPKLTAARWIVEQSKAGVQVAASAKRPQASITMTQTLSSTSDWPGFRKDNFLAALQVQYTLLDAGLASSQIAEAKENVSRASLNRDSVADSIKLSVTTDFMGTQEAALRIKKTASALDKARESYEISVFRYDQGVGTNIDVIDAQIALTQANSNYTQALCDYNIAVARLENSMGGLPARTDPEFDKKPKDKKSGGE
jgi:outer membrane protein TolC